MFRHSAKTSQLFGRAEYYRMSGDKIKSILFDNLQSGDAKITKQIINSYNEVIDLDTLDKNGNSLLHLACSKGHLESVQALVEAGAGLEIVDSRGCTALHVSSAGSQVEITRFLLQSGADVMKHNKDGELPLDVAATLDIALILVEKMISLGHKDLVDDYLLPLKLTKNFKGQAENLSTGKSIISSIESANMKLCDQLKVADSNGEDQVGCRFRLSNIGSYCESCRQSDESSDESDEKSNSTQTRRYTFPSAVGLPKPMGSILKRPASYGEYPTVRESQTDDHSQEKKTVPEKKSSNRAVTFPSDILCQVCIMDNDYKDMKRLILSDKIRNIDKIYANGISALHLASIEGRPKCVEVLIDCGANIENTDPHGWTPLHAAVVSGNIKCIKQLCRRGADLCATTNDGETVFDLAESELIRKYLKMMTIRLVMNTKKHFNVRRLNSC